MQSHYSVVIARQNRTHNNLDSFLIRLDILTYVTDAVYHFGETLLYINDICIRNNRKRQKANIIFGMNSQPQYNHCKVYYQVVEVTLVILPQFALDLRLSIVAYLASSTFFKVHSVMLCNASFPGPPCLPPPPSPSYTYFRAGHLWPMHLFVC